MSVKTIYKRVVPLFLRSILSRFFYKIHLCIWPFKSYFLLKRLSKKEKINVLLMLYNVDAWKLHSLYREFEGKERYEPIVVVCPIVTKGEDFLIEKLNASVEYCKNKNYNYFLAYDFEKSTVVNIRKALDCDIVFFTNPNPLSGEVLYIDNFDDCLTCYVPYSFRIDRLFGYDYNSRTVNKVWKCFYETEIHKELAEKYADNKGRNVVVSGFPYLDVFKKKELSAVDDTRKLIVWAPHWTIKGAQETGLDWSCFLDYSEFILALAEKYKDRVRFVMKPHPFLFDTLRQEKVWGDAKTESYLKRWERIENCSIETGDYAPLFFESDALIHDSGSFMTEYLLQNKPMAYTSNVGQLIERFNDWGFVVLKAHTVITNQKELEGFVNNLLIVKDSNKKIRESLLVKHELLRQGGGARAIVNHIENCIR